MEELSENIKNLIEYSKGGILSKEITKNSKLDVTLFCMAKETGISEHTSTKSGFVYVVEGNGVFNLNGKDIAMLPGVFIEIKENIIHSIKAKDNTSFLLSLIS